DDLEWTLEASLTEEVPRYRIDSLGVDRRQVYAFEARHERPTRTKSERAQVLLDVLLADLRLRRVIHGVAQQLPALAEIGARHAELHDAAIHHGGGISDVSMRVGQLRELPEERSIARQ